MGRVCPWWFGYVLANPLRRLLQDPRKLLARSSDWVFAPETEYEQRGLVPDVVYTCGALERDGEVWMYYGGADTVIGLATARTSDLVEFVLEHDFLREQPRSVNDLQRVAANK